MSKLKLSPIKCTDAPRPNKQADTKVYSFIRRLLAEFPRESPTDVANEVNEMGLVTVSIETIKLILNKIGIYMTNNRLTTLI